MIRRRVSMHQKYLMLSWVVLLMGFTSSCGGSQWYNTEYAAEVASTTLPDSVTDFIEATTPVVSYGDRPLSVQDLADAAAEEEMILGWRRVLRPFEGGE